VTQLELEFDCRLLPDLMSDQIEAHVRQGIQKVAARFPGLNITVVKDRVNPGLSVPQESDFLRGCLDSADSAGIEPRLKKKSSSTEAALFAQAGYDVAVFGPGEWMGVSHAPNEFLELDQLERAITFYEKVIERVCV
jgi:acetylornithine deacetylase/succinyl-diaminopimelate desuccinylase-like protein